MRTSRLLWSLLILSIIGIGASQAQVLQNGSVTPGHPAAWTTNGVIQDGGASTAGFINTLGITGTGLPFCINSAAITGPYQEFCLGLTSTTATISLQNYGGASAGSLVFDVNGTSYSFPFVVGGIVGPATTVVNDLACWNNTVGTLLKDCGLIGNPVAVANGGTGVTALGAGITNAGANPGLTVDPTYIQGFLGGLTMSNDGSSPNTVIDTTAGVANSDDNTTLMKIAAFTKSVSGAWSVGAGAGCLDSGSSFTASTWYSLFVIERTDTGVVDELCSTSATSPSLPASYTKKRRIGSYKTDGSTHILAFSQNGDEFLWSASILDIDVTTLSTTPTLETLSGVPSGIKMNALVRGGFANATPGIALLINSPDEAAILGGNVGSNGTQTAQVSSQGVNFGGLSVRTNTSAQIRIVASGASSTLLLYTYGWIDLRGKLQ